MKVMQKISFKKCLKMVTVISVLSVLFGAISPAITLTKVVADEKSFEDDLKENVDIRIIQELSDDIGRGAYDLTRSDSFYQPSLSLAFLVAHIYTTEEKATGSNRWSDAINVLKYLYPEYATDLSVLKRQTVTAEQAIDWLHSVGYEAQVQNTPLTSEEIKEELGEAKPIIPILQCDSADYWIEQETAIVLYAHSDVTYGGANLHTSFGYSVPYGDIQIADGQEKDTIHFLGTANYADDVSKSATYHWVKTITNIQKDPSFDKMGTADGDRAKGVFNVKNTYAGDELIECEFTDEDVLQSLGKNQWEGTKPKFLDALAVNTINLYADSEHQKTVDDLYEFLGKNLGDHITLQEVQNWYADLGIVSDYEASTAPWSKAKIKEETSKGKFFLSSWDEEYNTEDHNVASLCIGFRSYDNAQGAKWGIPYRAGVNVYVKYEGSGEEAYVKWQEKIKAWNFDGYGLAISTLTEPYLESPAIYYTGTLSNIHKKDAEAVLHTEKVNPLATTNTNVSAVYTTATDFKIRETQGAVPWCARYSVAAAVNTLKKDNVTNARELMHLEFPNEDDETLETHGGGYVSDMIDIIQKNYQTTCDFEQKTVSYEQVKKEIDADKILVMDLKNLTDDEEGVGHAVTIVGYVEPSDGDLKSHPPFYEVWNPWWTSILYVSAKEGNYLELEGTKYEWERTWHNFRNYNPKTMKSTPDEDLSKVPLYDMGKETSAKSLVGGDTFGYRLSTDYAHSKMEARHDSNKVTIPSMSDPAQTYRKDVDSLSEVGSNLLKSLGGFAVAVTAIAIAQLVPVVDLLVDALLLLGIIKGGKDGFELAVMLYDYVNVESMIRVDFLACMYL